MTTSPAIRVRGLTRTFGEMVALSKVDLDVAAGEVRALLGPNGAGKTTLIRIIVGSVRPTLGEVEVVGIPWSQLARSDSRTKFGLVTSGDRSSYHRLSGLENLIFFGRLYGLSKAEARERAMDVLEQVGLADAARVRTGNYSRGMQKRLVIARALLMQPKVLLVDEATHDLDPAGARQVREMLRTAAGRGTAVLWATQRVDEVADTADSVTILHHGEVRFDGTVEKLARSFEGRRYRIELAGRPDAAIGGLSSHLEPLAQTGVYAMTLPDNMTLGQVVTTLASEGVEIVDCRLERSEIEDAFLILTKDARP